MGHLKALLYAANVQPAAQKLADAELVLQIEQGITRRGPVAFTVLKDRDGPPRVVYGEEAQRLLTRVLGQSASHD